MASVYETRLETLLGRQRELVRRRNEVDEGWTNGVFERFRHPVLTAGHTPLYWRYDLDPVTNPLLLERLGINAVFNAGAIEQGDAILLVCRVEGADRKSFFAIAESSNGIDQFRFWNYPIRLPETEDPDVNVYDMRLTRHEDGFVYGLFCTERKDPASPPGDSSSAIAQCGIVRTRDLSSWERLPDLVSDSPQQRNVVLHPEFIDGQYGLYTRPQDGFIEAGQGGGIAWALCASMERAVIRAERIVDPKTYHTVKEVKNGQGPPPIKTRAGWLHIAHGVRNTAAGLRYVLYAFLTALERPDQVTHRPGGYLLAPEGAERVGDVSNVVFSNGAVARPNGELLLYYGSSDTRVHVARSTVERMVDYVLYTPEDPLRSGACVEQRTAIIRKNLELIGSGRGHPLLSELG